jgi:hypothetical protein
VNGREAGRCLDVTNAHPDFGFPYGGGPGTYDTATGTDYPYEVSRPSSPAGSSATGPGGFLIDYMCKQFPDTASYPAWNQRFRQVAISYDSRSYWELRTTDGGMTFCLWNPETVVNLAMPPDETHGWVEVRPCPPNDDLTSNFAWRVHTGRAPFPTRFAITDSTGTECLEADLDDPQQPGYNNDAFSTIAVASCDGSGWQRWNVPPSPWHRRRWPAPPTTTAAAPTTAPAAAAATTAQIATTAGSSPRT